MKSKLTVLITGATSGIGRHAARHLLARGHRVIATGRSQSALRELQAEQPGAALDAIPLDVTDPQSIAAARDEVLQRTHGRGIDALVNNAGYGHLAPAAEISDDDLRAQFETNVFGLLRVTQAFLPQLMARRGRVVNISSIGGKITFPMFGVYSASKHAVEALSDNLRNELAPFGVRVAIVEPGAIKSQFSNRAAAVLNRYDQPHSLYAPIFARAHRLESLAARQAVGPEATSRAIERALTARRPRARYVTPFSARLLLLLMAIAPTRLIDFISQRIAGLTPRGLKLKARSAS